VAGLSSMDAARRTFRQLLMPAIIALLADLVGFITILLIPVRVVQEMAGHRQHRRRHRDPHRSRAAAGAGVVGEVG
jgi:inner membrane protein involved in colicin E2 resistance